MRHRGVRRTTQDRLSRAFRTVKTGLSGAKNAPAVHSPHGMENLPISMVDNAVTPRLYTPHNGAPPRFRRDGAPAKLLTDGVTRRPISVGCLEFRRLPGLPGRGSPDPGLFDK